MCAGARGVQGATLVVGFELDLASYCKVLLYDCPETVAVVSVRVKTI